jgi:hypothetical protein
MQQPEHKSVLLCATARAILAYINTAWVQKRYAASPISQVSLLVYVIFSVHSFTSLRTSFSKTSPCSVHSQMYSLASCKHLHLRFYLVRTNYKFCLHLCEQGGKLCISCARTCSLEFRTDPPFDCSDDDSGDVTLVQATKFIRGHDAIACCLYTLSTGAGST